MNFYDRREVGADGKEAEQSAYCLKTIARLNGCASGRRNPVIRREIKNRTGDEKLRRHSSMHSTKKESKYAREGAAMQLVNECKLSQIVKKL